MKKTTYYISHKDGTRQYRRVTGRVINRHWAVRESTPPINLLYDDLDRCWILDHLPTGAKAGIYKTREVAIATARELTKKLGKVLDSTSVDEIVKKIPRRLVDKIKRVRIQ